MHRSQDHIQKVAAPSRCASHLFQACLPYRYASLYFIIAVPMDENELLVLELIQKYVETLDKYFGNVCELDLIFNFQKVLLSDHLSVHPCIYLHL